MCDGDVSSSTRHQRNRSADSLQAALKSAVREALRALYSQLEPSNSGCRVTSP